MAEQQVPDLSGGCGASLEDEKKRNRSPDKEELHEELLRCRKERCKQIALLLGKGVQIPKNKGINKTPAQSSEGLSSGSFVPAACSKVSRKVVPVTGSKVSQDVPAAGSKVSRKVVPVTGSKVSRKVVPVTGSKVSQDVPAAGSKVSRKVVPVTGSKVSQDVPAAGSKVSRKVGQDVPVTGSKVSQDVPAAGSKVSSTVGRGSKVRKVQMKGLVSGKEGRVPKYRYVIKDVGDHATRIYKVLVEDVGEVVDVCEDFCAELRRSSNPAPLPLSIETCHPRVRFVTDESMPGVLVPLNKVDNCYYPTLAELPDKFPVRLCDEDEVEFYLDYYEKYKIALHYAGQFCVLVPRGTRGPVDKELIDKAVAWCTRYIVINHGLREVVFGAEFEMKVADLPFVDEQ